jgi:hypothetical protein
MPWDGETLTFDVYTVLFLLGIVTTASLQMF